MEPTRPSKLQAHWLLSTSSIGQDLEIRRMLQQAAHYWKLVAKGNRSLAEFIIPYRVGLGISVERTIYWKPVPNTRR